MRIDTSRGRWLALGCVLGPAVFTLAWFVLGFISDGYDIGGERVEGYSPAAQPISGLGMGDTAPYMNAGFILGGLLTVIGVVGVFAPLPGGRWPLVLLCVANAGLTVAGVFDLEHGALHFLGFGLVAAVPIVGFPIAGRHLRRFPHWRRLGTWLMAAGPLTLVFLVAYLASFDVDSAGHNEGIAGLTSRALGLEVQAWYVVMGLMAFRQKV
jgi:hypothetical membrane protein